jgi:hypothetical protein
MTQVTQDFSPRPALKALGMTLDPHVLQWFVVGFGAFVVLNLFQSLKLTDKPTYNVMLSPSLMLLPVSWFFLSLISRFRRSLHY